eukprot:TRINITY_DN11856_c0_g1_i1.p2 TRINITY_DN11856_c0_g1~~TRINITY_DN11856_c0_g1_i1.p2  ORF type:complete len:114 (+),score=32.99 TRINITY_DN11856_c0_g1_i1:47-388(+)
MLRSLVGSEMCIRDRGYCERLHEVLKDWEGGVDVVVVCLGWNNLAGEPGLRVGVGHELKPVDYTRLGNVLSATGLQVLVLQEGGYDLQQAGETAAAFLAGFQPSSYVYDLLSM